MGKRSKGGKARQKKGHTPKNAASYVNADSIMFEGLRDRADREFFREHKTRKYYLRRAFPCEYEEHGLVYPGKPSERGTMGVVVINRAPGLRMRYLFQMPEGAEMPAPLHWANEQLAQAILDGAAARAR